MKQAIQRMRQIARRAARKARPAGLVAGGLILAGCALEPSVVARGIDPQTPLLARGGEAAVPAFSVAEIRVIVPESLKVSEANTYKPVADIVWRGDPYGDRYAQVAAIMRAAAERGLGGLQGARQAIVEIELVKFHALTERARYTVGGTHDIDFWIRVLDAESGEVIVPRRLIDTELPALGGRVAIAAEARGETQKVRIEAFIAQVIAAELGGAGLDGAGLDGAGLDGAGAAPPAG